MQLEETNVKAAAGLANVLIKLNDIENAEQILSGATGQNDPIISAAKATLETAKQLSDNGDFEALEKAVQVNPDDHQSRFDLSPSLWAAGAQEKATDHLLYIIESDSSWQEDGARTQLRRFFEMAGPMYPFKVAARRGYLVYYFHKPLRPIKA